MVLVRDVMTTEVVTLAPDTKIADAADLLAERRFGGIPVVDADGRLLGMLGEEDLIITEARVHVPSYITLLGVSFPLPGSQKHLEEELHKVAGSTVGDVMDDEPVTITPDATLEDLATIMHEQDVTHLPVVDPDERVVGIVARGDVVRHIASTT